MTLDERRGTAVPPHRSLVRHVVTNSCFFCPDVPAKTNRKIETTDPFLKVYAEKNTTEHQTNPYATILTLSNPPSREPGSPGGASEQRRTDGGRDGDPDALGVPLSYWTEGQIKWIGGGGRRSG